MKKIQSIRGTRDLIGDDARKLSYIIDVAVKTANNFNYHQIITPIIEPIAVFTESLGQHSDIVYKEMFVFKDRGDEEICLRPENTAGVIRAFVENGWQQNLPCKFFYHGPMFRYERPQRGRYRQFHQFGIEYLHQGNDKNHVIDGEVIGLGYEVLKKLGLDKKIKLEINSLANRESRHHYRQALVDYLNPYKAELSPDSQWRLKENPLRILDSKDDGDKKIIQSAPTIADYYDDASKESFDGLQKLLQGRQIPYQVNKKLVRGLDYYCHTTFEFITDQLGAQGTVLAGGRYDGLVAMFGGGDVAGVGFAMGIERLIEMIIEKNTEKPLVMFCPLGRDAHAEAQEMATTWRRYNIRCDITISDKLKKSLDRANKQTARIAIIIGDDELKNKQCQWKDLQSGDQQTMSLEDALAQAKKLS